MRTALDSLITSAAARSIAYQGRQVSTAATTANSDATCSLPDRGRNRTEWEPQETRLSPCSNAEKRKSAESQLGGVAPRRGRRSQQALVAARSALAREWSITMSNCRGTPTIHDLSTPCARDRRLIA